MKGQINMKKLTKILSLMLALTMLLNFPVAVSAAELEDAPIDESRTGSLTIYKYDLTNAEKDGVWDSSYVSTGVFDQTGVNDMLGGSGASLGNGETGYGYAIKGVEFSYVQVADIVQFSEHPKKDMYVTWRCKDGDNYFWGHYTINRYEALKDLCQRAEKEIDYLAAIGEIPPITSQKEQERER